MNTKVFFLYMLFSIRPSSLTENKCTINNKKNSHSSKHHRQQCKGAFPCTHATESDVCSE